MIVSTRSGLYVTQGLRQRYVLSPLLFNIFFAAVTHAVVVRFSEDPDIMRNLDNLEEDLENAAGVSTDLLALVRRAVWGMLYADDAGVVSRSAEGLAKMMTVIVTVFEAASLTVSENTETMLLRTSDQAPCTSPLVIEAAGQRHRQTTPFCIWAVLSTQAPILCQISNGGSDSHGHATVNSSGNCTIWRLPRSL